MGNKGKVMVAMSGGVDSSVAALLLHQQGYEVIGVTMRLFTPEIDDAKFKPSRSCCSLEDVEDARRVCRDLGIRHLYMNFENEFRQFVIDYFVSEYEKGRTPHPCIACNDRIKFDFLFKRARAIADVEYIATGHYARRELIDGEWSIQRGIDKSKDQSYVLYNLTQEQMTKLLLPVGQFSKDEIRDLARQFNLTVADKPDSQDICFIPLGDYKQFIEPKLKTVKRGNIIDMNDRILAQHDGIHRFTIGQRKGLPSFADGNNGTKRVYVTDIDVDSGNVRVGSLRDLARDHTFASNVNWIAGTPPQKPVACSVRIRYAGAMEEAVVHPMGNWTKVVFKKPMLAVTPGQSVVFYDGDTVLGGGFIELQAPPVAQSILN